MPRDVALFATPRFPEVFDVSRRLSFVSKGRGLREGRCKGIYELTELTENERRDVLEFVFREDEARFGATRAGITAVRLIGGLQKELMKWQAMQKRW